MSGGARSALERSRSRLPEALKVLEALVVRESPSRDEARNRELALWLSAAMEGRGGRVEAHSAPGYGDHLVGRFPGEQSGAAHVLVIGHMDTVHPLGTLERSPFRVDGERVRGPGCYDMKVGLTVVLEAIGLAQSLGERPRTDVVFLVTCDEEVGSPTSRGLIEELARNARAALVVEPCVPGGDLKVRRKGVAAYGVRVTGRPAHAGIEPEAGASAIHELARQIPSILALQDTLAGTTLNVGVVRGGTRGNVVAEEAFADVDVRFWTPEEAARLDAGLRGLRTLDPRCRIDVEGGIDRSPLERTPASDLLFDIAREEGELVGLRLGRGGTGGASDGNLTSGVGCPTLDGLGPDGGGAHSLDEHVLVADIASRIALMFGLLKRL